MGACCSADAELAERAMDSLEDMLANPSCTLAPTFEWRKRDFEGADLSSFGQRLGQALLNRSSIEGAKSLSLDLSKTFLTDQTCLGLGEGLRASTQLKLTLLNLSYNEITSKGARRLQLHPGLSISRLLIGGNRIAIDAIGALIAACPAATEVQLPIGDDRCVIRDDNSDMLSVVNSLKQCRRLNKVVFRLWGLGLDSGAVIQLIVSCGSSVDALTISGEAEVDVKLDALAGSAQALTQAIKGMQAFELSHVALSPNSVLAIADALSTSSRLTELALQHGGVTTAGARRIAQQLKTNRTLTKLDLCHNPDMKDDGVRSIFEMLRDNKRLKALFILGVQFSDASLAVLCKSLEYPFGAPLTQFRDSVVGGSEMYRIKLGALLDAKGAHSDTTSSPPVSDDEVDVAATPSQPNQEGPANLAPYSPRSPVAKSAPPASSPLPASKSTPVESSGATFYVPPASPSPAQKVEDAPRTEPPMPAVVGSTTAGRRQFTSLLRPAAQAVTVPATTAAEPPAAAPPAREPVVARAPNSVVEAPPTAAAPMAVEAAAVVGGPDAPVNEPVPPVPSANEMAPSQAEGRQSPSPPTVMQQPVPAATSHSVTPARRPFASALRKPTTAAAPAAPTDATTMLSPAPAHAVVETRSPFSEQPPQTTAPPQKNPATEDPTSTPAPVPEPEASHVAVGQVAPARRTFASSALRPTASKPPEASSARTTPEPRTPVPAATAPAAIHVDPQPAAVSDEDDVR